MHNQGLNTSTGFITRLTIDEHQPTNSGQSIESLRNLLNNYLLDVDYPSPAYSDDRPIWEDASEGSQLIDGMNQMTIIDSE